VIKDAEDRFIKEEKATSELFARLIGGPSRAHLQSTSAPRRDGSKVVTSRELYCQCEEIHYLLVLLCMVELM
jgi:hypothetical protein